MRLAAVADVRLGRDDTFDVAAAAYRLDGFGKRHTVALGDASFRQV
jgi:hypothetical protein